MFSWPGEELQHSANENIVNGYYHRFPGYIRLLCIEAIVAN